MRKPTRIAGTRNKNGRPESRPYVQKWSVSDYWTCAAAFLTERPSSDEDDVFVAAGIPWGAVPVCSDALLATGSAAADSRGFFGSGTDVACEDVEDDTFSFSVEEDFFFVAEEAVFFFEGSGLAVASGADLCAGA